MANQIIKNTQMSTLDLTPMHDVFDNIVVLRPKGTKGDSREISEETARHEIVKRVKAQGWIEISDVPIFKVDAAGKAFEPPVLPAVTSPTPFAPSTVVTPSEPPAPPHERPLEPTLEMPAADVEALVEKTQPTPTPKTSRK